MNNPPIIPQSNSRTGDALFAHQIEEEFTRILDYYGISWEYEPHTFPLEWDPQGNVIEGFSPDFYLPQQNLYIELTTLRPNLTTKKNRKIRRLKELYPGINIKLFKRSDLRQMLMKYGLEEEVGKISGNQAQK